MSRKTPKTKLERPRIIQRTRPAAVERQYDRLIARALTCLNKGDDVGFWDGMEKVNAFNNLYASVPEA